jgi:hypothetical protein
VAVTVLGAVRELLASVLPAELRNRIDEGAPPEDLKGQALPRLVLIDQGESYSRTTEDVAEVRLVTVKAIHRTRTEAEALLSRAALPLDNNAPMDVGGLRQTYCLRENGQVGQEGRYDALEGDGWQAARATWRVRVKRPK